VNRLAGLRIALAGAGGTLGSALAERLIKEGCAGLILGDIADKAASNLSDSLQRNDVTVLGTRLDVTSEESTKTFVATAVEQLGGLDVFISNVGVLSRSARMHNVELADLQRVLSVNVAGVFNGMKAATLHMRAHGGGSLINTASVAGVSAWAHASPYCASKAAVIQLTKVAALEYAKEGIRVNCVCPGTFRSAIHDGLPDEALQAIAERHPIGRLAYAEEMLGAFVYLASAESSFTTGAVIVVDGGYSC
jgi:NAD(P)-dependent dehydrogenase (short-subunit alcohol dehydrogenase family)